MEELKGLARGSESEGVVQEAGEKEGPLGRRQSGLPGSDTSTAPMNSESHPEGATGWFQKEVGPCSLSSWLPASLCPPRGLWTSPLATWATPQDSELADSRVRELEEPAGRGRGLRPLGTPLGPAESAQGVGPVGQLPELLLL